MWSNPQETANLVTFTKGILNGKLHFSCSDIIMPEENVNQEFRLTKIDEIRNYLIEEINQNKLLSKKHKKVVKFWSILTTYLL